MTLSKEFVKFSLERNQNQNSGQLWCKNKERKTKKKEIKYSGPFIKFMVSPDETGC